mgnify:CR=1 FL=1
MVNSDGDTVDYFGGEKFNAEFAEAAKRVTSKFEFLPYDVYARSVFHRHCRGLLTRDRPQ